MTTREPSRVLALLRRLSEPRRGVPWYRDPPIVAGSAIAALAIWSFAMLFEDVWGRDALVRWDAAAAAWVHRQATPGGRRFFHGLTQLGASNFTLMMGAAIAPALWRYPVLFVGWIATFAGGAGLEYVFKAIVHRARPPFAYEVLHHPSYSFPSGHSMASTVGYVMLAYLIVRLTGPRGWHRAAVYAGAAIVILAVGVSRIYLGVHYPSDVLGGFVIGAAWVALCLTAIRAVERRARIPF